MPTQEFPTRRQSMEYAVHWCSWRSGQPPATDQFPEHAESPRFPISIRRTPGFFRSTTTTNSLQRGSHLLKGGVGVRHTVNDVNLFYPGGYVVLNWNRSFTSTASGSTKTGRGIYGYYEVNDRLTTGAVKANMPSLYVQDTWTIGNRLTLNLGVRTEKETIPSFREDIKANAFDFNFNDKIAPRVGASFDVLGNGRLKAFGSWGRYFDWVRYELARGSYGGDKWNVYYRALDTLDVFSLNLSNKPGADLWGSASGFRDRRVPNFDSTEPNIKPMYQDATNAGIEYQINPTTVFGATYVHNKLTRTIEDLGGVVNGDEVYVIGNPGEGLGAITPASGKTPPFATPLPLRQDDALELTLSRRFSQSWFASGNVTIAVLRKLRGNREVG